MPETLPFILLLALLVGAAKLGGWITSRLGQAAVLGELVVGLLLGPTLLDVFRLEPFHQPALEETVFLLAELGVLFLMFIAGLEVHPGEMLRAGRVAVSAGILGVVVPILMAAGTALAFGFDRQPAFYLGLVLAATSVSISAQVLIELRRLRTRVGTSLLAAAVVDDILVILVLSIFIAVTAGGSLTAASILTILGRMLVYSALAVGAGFYLLPRLAIRLERAPVSQGIMAGTLVVTLLYAWAAEALGGMAAITGSFLAGMLFARTHLKPHLEERMHTLSYSLLVPLFFVSIGLHTDLRALLDGNLLFTALFMVGAFVSKYVGGTLGAWLGGLPPGDASRLGIGMISRGEVGLILAAVGLGEGLLDQEGFAAVVAVIILTTLLTPVLLKLSYAGQEPAPGRPAGQEADRG